MALKESTGGGSAWGRKNRAETVAWKSGGLNQWPWTKGCDKSGQCRGRAHRSGPRGPWQDPEEPGHIPQARLRPQPASHVTPVTSTFPASNGKAMLPVLVPTKATGSLSLGLAWLAEPLHEYITGGSRANQAFPSCCRHDNQLASWSEIKLSGAPESTVPTLAYSHLQQLPQDPFIQLDRRHGFGSAVVSSLSFLICKVKMLASSSLGFYEINVWRDLAHSSPN